MSPLRYYTSRDGREWTFDATYQRWIHRISEYEFETAASVEEIEDHLQADCDFCHQPLDLTWSMAVPHMDNPKLTQRVHEHCVSPYHIEYDLKNGATK